MYKTIFHIPVHENIKGHTIWLIVHEKFNSRYFFLQFSQEPITFHLLLM